MQPTATIGDCELYLGDCLEILPTLGKVDALCTDPPYEFDASGAGIFRSNRTCMDEIQANKLDKGFDISIFSGKQFRSLVTFFHNDQLPKILPHIDKEFKRFCLCMWHKKNPMPVANKHYKPDTELYIHAWNEEGHPIGELSEKGRYFIAPIGQQNEFNHPTVKPLPLMLKIIKNVNAKTILDPFIGSGTTGVACVKLGRKFTGIEISEKYFDIACKRIEQAYAQPDLFIKPPIKIVQESMI